MSGLVSRLGIAAGLGESKPTDRYVLLFDNPGWLYPYNFQYQPNSQKTGLEIILGLVLIQASIC